jgi:hypothetical protein
MLIAGAAMHIELRNYTSLFCLVSFDQIAPSNSILGLQCHSDHVAKVRAVFAGQRRKRDANLKSMAETVSQQKPHWVDVTIEDT